MTPKADRTALIEARVAREREWALAAWEARLSWVNMRIAANQPVEAGGLGYDLSESALKGLVTKAREDRGDLSMTRGERVERQSLEVDARARAARLDMERAYANGTKIEPPRREDFYDPLEWANALAAYARAVQATTAAVESADRRLDAAHKREAALHGLDNPAELKIDVTHRDAVDAELNDMLARLGIEARAEAE